VTSLDALARAFLASAFTVLRTENVLPTSVFNPFLRVGRDYFGDSISGARGFAPFEAAITERHPRFSGETRPGRDFASGYIFSFLEAVVAEAAFRREELSPDASCVARCLSDLVAAVDADSSEVACCREVTSLTTEDGQPLEFEDITVKPVTASASSHRREASDRIAEVIPHFQSCNDQEEQGGFGPPHSIVVARETATDPFEQAKELSGRIDRFLLATRLLHAGTCESAYEIQGRTSLVGRFDPTLVRFRGGAGYLSPTGMLRRIVCLEARDPQRFKGLAEAMSAAEGEPRGWLVTSFGMATRKLQMSYHAHSWDEQLVDLSTAFEAALSGRARTDVLLRLKTRAAALLATDSDPARAIFRDIGRLYDIRSRLIHGSALSGKDLTKAVTAISTVPDSPSGLAVAHAVERLRDLVRRALLARVALASCNPPLWMLGEDKGVDAHLADMTTRENWRSALLGALESFDAAFAIDKPRTPLGFLGEHS